ncbi:MAG: HAD family hydrolase [Fastidiosipilaceae bacterium]|nr:HAD family phosphatase [Clostridiaceae bacterium]
MVNQHLILFDLDGTLAPLSRPIPETALIAIKALQDQGHIICIASGKPLYYLTGLCRQAGLRFVWLIGENGATLQKDVALPPRERLRLPISAAAVAACEQIRKDAVATFGDHIWFQPNEVAVTIFFDTAETQQAIREWLDIKENWLSENQLIIFPHNDSFDISPAHIDKGKAILKLLDYLGIDQKRSIAVGDTWNDVPMFEVCAEAIAIAFPEAKMATHHVADLDSAFDCIKTLL